MKILRVKFFNLNSLKGLHEICFDKSPLQEAGLFAITGPTGAGKTTLLDAITVGLYGRVHRHDRDAYEIMTRHTSESFSEVEFEVKGNRYCAKWSLYRSRKKADGKLQPIHMELQSLADKKLLDLKPSEVPGKIAEISGLDYGQFLRSVILSQGDFTRFLKASESERSDLLEKITDTSIYSHISVWAYRKADIEKKTLEQLRIKLENAHLLPDEQVAFYQQQVQEMGAQATEQQRAKQELERQITWLERLDTLQNKKNRLIAELQILEANYADQQLEFVKLQRHQKALQFKPALIQISTTQTQLHQLNKNLESVSTSIPFYQQQTIKAELELDRAKAEFQEARQALEKAEPVLDEVIRQDLLITSHQDNFRKGRAQFIKVQEDYQKTIELEEEKESALRMKQEKFAHTEDWLFQNQVAQSLDREIIIYQQFLKDLLEIDQEMQRLNQKTKAQQTLFTHSGELIKVHTVKWQEVNDQKAATFEKTNAIYQTLQQLLAGKTIAELEHFSNQLPGEINLAHQQYQLAQHYEQLTRKWVVLSESINRHQQADLQIKEQTAVLVTTLQEANEAVQHLQQIVELQRQIQKYEADRAELRPLQPCPLCGSEHHPFLDNKYHQNLSETEKKLQAQQQKFSDLQTRNNELLARQSSILGILTTEQNQLSEVIAEQEKIRSQFKNNQSKLTVDLGIDNALLIQDWLTSRQLQYENQKLLITQVRQVEENWYRLQKKQQDLKELLLGLDYELKQARENQEQAARQLKQLEEEKTDLQERHMVVKEQAQSFLLRFEITFSMEESSAIENKLKQRITEYAAYHQQLQDLKLDIKQIETERTNLQNQLQEKKKSLDEQKIQLQQDHALLLQLIATRKELFGIKDPHLERNNLKLQVNQQQQQLEQAQSAFQEIQEKKRLAESKHQQWQQDYAQVEAQVSLLTNELNRSVQAENIDSIDNLVQLFLTEEEANRIELLQKQAERQLTEHRKLLADTEQDLIREQELSLTNFSVPALLDQIQGINKSTTLLHQQMGSLQLLLQQDADLKNKHREIAAQIEIQQKEFKRWDKMAALIGSADGKKFSKFAQGLTLARLTELANRHLLKLNDRYRIYKNPDQDLELQIIDTYQADSVRSINTLSGGESFLVSLALALGLSDLAGRKAQINSLFIDEGFGTLDAETLDTAISALENLQTGGKLIGIISHVEALKERITTQIQVRKQPGGQSTISMIG